MIFTLNDPSRDHACDVLRYSIDILDAIPDNPKLIESPDDIDSEAEDDWDD